MIALTEIFKVDFNEFLKGIQLAKEILIKRMICAILDVWVLHA